MEEQQSRLDWLKDGDRNTALFQAKANERARSNRIRILLMEDGTVLTGQKKLECHAKEFYARLFTAQEELDVDAILQWVPSKVKQQMNDQLCLSYTAQEVERALFMMGPNKSPGPDGFTAGFYQLHWNVLDPSVIGAVLRFLNDGVMDSEGNLTTLVLIPKVKNPQNLKQFRPISL